MELLARRFVHLPTRVRRGVVDEAQGNPLALLEFAASAARPRQRSRHATCRPGRAARCGRCTRRGSSGSPSRRDACSCSPCSTAPASLGVLAAASGSGGLDDLGPAERDHLVVVDDRSGEMRFRHPMIKSVVVEHSTHDERRAAHQRLAELFADQPERRGHHLAEAAAAPDEDVAAAVEDGAHRTLATRRRRRRDLQAAEGGRSQPGPEGPEPAVGRRGVRRRPLRWTARQLVGTAARRSSQGSDAGRDAPRGGRHRLSPPQQRRQRGDDPSPADGRHRIRAGRARSGP